MQLLTHHQGDDENKHLAHVKVRMSGVSVACCLYCARGWEVRGARAGALGKPTGNEQGLHQYERV